MDMNNITIAVATDNGITISKHFGRAKFYEVLYVENGEVVKRERREKPNHHNFSHHEQHHHSHHQSNQQHGFDEHSRSKHFQMAETIKDCQILLAGGMGTGAYQNMLQLNIKPIVTDIKNIDDAVQAVINGSIKNHIEKLH